MGAHSDDDLDGQWRHSVAVVSPALALADPAFVAHISHECEVQGIQDAVRRHDTAVIFDWLLEKFQYQGMSDANVDRFTYANGPVSWSELAAGMKTARCSRLSSYWHFEGCGYRKFAATCAEPHLLAHCPVARPAFRNGRLSQSAFSLFLFVRDICNDDIVGWIDDRLGGADEHDHPRRSLLMRAALLEPLSNVHGLGHKVLSMALSDMLLAADPGRERWITTGASMIAVDTLVHNYLHRTGILRRWDSDHPYGPACYGEKGCAAIIEDISGRFDTRTINPDFPASFPRFVQHAIWRFCAQSQHDICNGNRIDDRRGCQIPFCPIGSDCDRLQLPMTRVASTSGEG